jgi:hypothetical protein
MRLVSLGSESTEVMLAQNGPSAPLHKLDVQRAAEGPLEAAPKGRGGAVVGSDIVTIAAGEG